MSLDSREPPQGDFVAYVEKIEREQLARAMLPHQLTDFSAGSPSVESRSLTATEAQRVLQKLRETKAAAGKPARGAVVGAAIGLALIAFGLAAEGGLFLAILGAVLLWHNLSKLLKNAATPATAPVAQKIDSAFGRSPQGGKRGHGG